MAMSSWLWLYGGSMATALCLWLRLRLYVTALCRYRYGTTALRFCIWPLAMLAMLAIVTLQLLLSLFPLPF